MKYIKLFKTKAEYEAYAADKDNFILPNLSFCEDTISVYSHKIAPPGFSEKYFTIEMIEDGTVDIGMPITGITSEGNPIYVSSMKYRLNGNEWIETTDGIHLSVQANDAIEISCESLLFTGIFTSLFNISNHFNVYGNIMSLLYFLKCLMKDFNSDQNF